MIDAKLAEQHSELVARRFRRFEKVDILSVEAVAEESFLAGLAKGREQAAEELSELRQLYYQVIEQRNDLYVRLRKAEGKGEARE